MNVQDILHEAEMLSEAERRELIEKLIARQAEPKAKLYARRNLMELAGLGAEIWQGIDAQEYVTQLRDEWDHHYL